MRGRKNPVSGREPTRGEERELFLLVEAVGFGTGPTPTYAPSICINVEKGSLDSQRPKKVQESHSTVPLSGAALEPPPEVQGPNSRKRIWKTPS